MLPEPVRTVGLSVLVGRALVCTVLVVGSPDGAAAQRSSDLNPVPVEPVSLPALLPVPETGSGRFFFYRPLDYGSATVTGAIPLILNRGFHVSRISPGFVRLPNAMDGASTFWTSVTNPIEAIEAGGGWRAFARTELFPFRWDLGSAWVSNYVGHTIETGISFRTLAEYYEHKEIPLPRLWAATASLATSAMVEIYESQHKEVPLQKATVADFYLFDPLGIVLFSSDGVSAFFADKLGARVWPHQPGFSLRDGVMTNSGLDLAFKVGLPFTDKVRLFGRVGLGQDLGVTWKGKGDLNYSFGFGWIAADLQTDAATGDESIHIAGAASFFIDRNESLLASVQWNASKSRSFMVNLYPGSIPLLGPDFGGWFVVTGWGKRVIFGLSHRRLQGLGLGW